MKKILALMLVLMMVAALFAGCADANPDSNKPTKPTEPSTPAAGVMTHAEFLAADNDAPVEIECYVQATQSWWDNKITVYAQDQEGGYFAYELSCSEEDAAKLVPGTKINIKGYKTSYKGMPEVAPGATFTVVEGADTYIAPAVDMTDLLGKQELIEKAGMKASFKGLTIAKIDYKNGEPGDDIYVDFTLGDKTFSFCVERYLTAPDTDVYNAFAELQVGDVVDVQGFVYWYDADEDASGDGINTHITAVYAPMTHAEYMATEIDQAVEIECYVQATQSWWDNKIVVYAQDQEGGYFAYNLACSEEDAAKLVPGTKINIKGYKTAYKGMPEVAEDATFTFVNDGETYIAESEDMTALLGSQDLVNKSGMKASFKGLTIAKIDYKNGEPGDDIYVDFTLGDKTYSFCVERYLTDPETDVYKAFADLQIGDVVDVEGFVYWYDADEDASGDGINTHITAVTPVVAG